MIRHLGYACINTTFNSSKKNRITTNRTLRLKSFSPEKACDLIEKNCVDLLKILKWNVENNIYYFRISSDIFPFFDYKGLEYKLEDYPAGKRAIKFLKLSGDFAKNNNVKLEMHPGPFNCLASKKDYVVENTIRNLEMHSLIADYLGYDNDFKINIHVGSVNDGDFEKTAIRFINGFERLSERCKSRLTLENDDKKNMWTIQKLYNLICKEIKIPIVLDYHHWLLNNEGEDIRESAELAFSLWNCVPTTHYSESRSDDKLVAHSDYIDNCIEDLNRVEYDVMIEAKMKEQALLRARQKNLV